MSRLVPRCGSGVGERLNALLRGVDQLGDRWADVRIERIVGIGARQLRGGGELQPAGSAPKSADKRLSMPAPSRRRRLKPVLACS